MVAGPGTGFSRPQDLVEISSDSFGGKILTTYFVAPTLTRSAAFFTMNLLRWNPQMQAIIVFSYE